MKKIHQDGSDEDESVDEENRSDEDDSDEGDGEIQGVGNLKDGNDENRSDEDDSDENRSDEDGSDENVIDAEAGAQSSCRVPSPMDRKLRQQTKNEVKTKNIFYLKII